MLSVIFKARKFVKGFLRGFCWKSQEFLPPFDHPRHLKIESNPPLGALVVPKTGQAFHLAENKV